MSRLDQLKRLHMNGDRGSRQQAADLADALDLAGEWRDWLKNGHAERRAHHAAETLERFMAKHGGQ